MHDEIDPDVVTAFERATWTRCADSYLDTFAKLTGMALPLLVGAARIEPGSSVLEIGSGPGHIAGALAARGADVRGIDFSAEMVEVARRAHPTLAFTEANAERIPAQDATFDAVVANFVVHHLADPTRVCREIKRVLEPGGRFAFVVWGAPEEQSSLGVFFSAVAAHHDIGELPSGPLFGVTDRDVYARIVQAAGLADFELSQHRLDWVCDSLDPVLRGLFAWGRIGALPEETQRKIEADARRSAQAFARDGSYHLPHTVLLGSAVA
ncbi:MAG: class I SAM-dependent methyltransferase [Planctomycetota bacterium]